MIMIIKIILKKLKEGGKMEDIKKIFAFAKEYHYKLYLSILMAISSVLLGIVPFYLVYKIIMAFLKHPEVEFTYLLKMTILILAVLIAKSYLFLKAMSASHEAAFDTLMGMRKSLAEKLIKMPMGEIKKRSSGQLKNIIVDMVEEMELILAHLIPEGVSYIVVPTILVICIFFLDWRLALAALGTVPISLIIFKLMMQNNEEKMEYWFKAGDKMNSNIVEYISGMEVIKIFKQITDSFSRYTDSVKDYEKYTLEWFRESWNYMAGFFVILPATLSFVVPLGAYFHLQGTLTLPTYILVMMLAMGLGEPLSKLARFIESITMIKRKSQAINEMLASEELDLNENNLALVNHNITFDNVSFAYDQEEVLKDINFLAEQDTVTALVGESGSGKSTIAKLIVRFWDPQKGKIRLDGVDIKELSFAQLMEKISYVSQDIYLFDTTIRENIRMGDLTATDKKVEEAAKLAQCHEFIKELENGYDTLTGDAGNKLSGGQKQRISIARSLLKDAPIIILDEATAFTDPENEDRIQMALNDLIEGKTLLVIAHRLSTITGADNIILMDQGQIAAQGTHQQLLKKSAIYKKLWQAHREAMEWDIKVEGVKANV